MLCIEFLALGRARVADFRAQLTQLGCPTGAAGEQAGAGLADGGAIEAQSGAVRHGGFADTTRVRTCLTRLAAVAARVYTGAV